MNPDQETVRCLDSPRQLAEWADRLVAHHRRQLDSRTPPVRQASCTASAGVEALSAAWVLRIWDDLSAGFTSLQRKNRLVDGADPAVLATAFMAALQGGYLLSVTTRRIAPLEIAVEMALAQVARSLADEDEGAQQ
jgi:TetR/AcrR family transcriptional regulator, transcriptional repressor for nem operon